tara:strand:+ start:677 stop:1309 length:633 start_codon:yes stop_codon:yes gene_type:complete
MTIETFPIRLYTEVLSLTDNDKVTHYPNVQVSFNDDDILNTKLEPTESNPTQSLLPTWMDIQAKEDEKNTTSNIAIIEFNIDLDDDLDMTHDLKLTMQNYDTEWANSLKRSEKDDFGFYIKDIELNEISIESLVYTSGIIDIPLCEEENYNDDGFIQEYLVREKLTDGLQVIDGRYHYITNGDFVHMAESSYTISFKTPLYLWLLELLLQ